MGGGGLHRLPLILSLNRYFVPEPFMNTGRVWLQLYKIVLFELDANKGPDRIAAAETALVRRACELFYSAGDNIEEEHAYR